MSESRQPGAPVKTLRLAFRAQRQSLAASSDLWVLILALIVAVAAVTAVTRITDRVASAMLAQGSQTLAGDLRLDLTAPLDTKRRALLQHDNLRVADIATFPSAATQNDKLQLVSVKAVSATYPLRGQVTIRRTLAGTTTQTLDHGPRPGNVWVEPRLLAALSLQLGDRLSLGQSHLHITGLIINEPDRGPDFIDSAPRVMMAWSDLAATGLIGPGARVHYAALMAGTPDDIAAASAALSKHLAPGERVLTPEQANRGLATAVAKARVFLNLAALVAVVLAGIAVAMSAHQHARARLDEIALYKTLGAGHGVITRMLIWQLAMIGAVGIVLGVVAGELAQWALGGFAQYMFSVALPTGHRWSAWPAPATGLVLLAGFAWPALAGARSAPPARVLARTADDDRMRRWPTYVVAGLSVLLMAAAATRDIGLTWRVAAAAVIAAAALALAARAALWLAAWVAPRIGSRMGPGVRLGLGGLARRPQAIVLQTVAFGIGLTLIFLLVVVRGDLLAGWQANVAADAPNRFLININPAQTKPVGAFLSAHGVDAPQFYPIVRARLTAVNGKQLATDAALTRSAGRLARRAMNLSWMGTLKPDNRVLKGHWWAANTVDKRQISIDQSVARQLNVGVGDSLAFDVAGQPLAARITSVRDVDWSSLQANFFVLFPPGALDRFPTTVITGFYLPPAAPADAMARLVQRFPNISVIDIAALLAQVETLIDRVSLAVEMVFGFTLVAGFVVLLAAVGASRSERRREAAVLRALGARRRWLRQSIWFEYLTIGALSSVLAAIVAQATAIVIAHRLLHVEYTVRVDVWIVTLIVTTLAIAIVGALSLGDVLKQPAWKSLRASQA